MSAKQSLTGKVTLVTGASSGIGEAIARRFAVAGSTVVVSARRREKLQRLAQDIRADGGQAVANAADVTDYVQVKNLMDTVCRDLGRIDILVNNAGHAVAKSVQETTPQEMDAQIDANLKGVCYGCHAALPHMVRRKDGHIINIGSICSRNHYPGYAAYVAAKFGVLGFSRSLYEEVRKHGIRVNVLCPAAVNTAWADVAGAELPWPREERLQPMDLAETALFCVTLPKRVQVDTLFLWPVCEPTV
ncbi:MAG: SDR family oxidoreductase [Pirellulales bacterium]|nr:SDR family oxidoreductase [Pirellulales bacterium]